MINRDQANKLSYLKPWSYDSSYVKNLIIHACLVGDTAIRFERVFTTNEELQELRDLGYTVEEHINQNDNNIRVYWNHE